MSTEYKVWNTYAGALEDDETFEFAAERDAKAAEMTEDLRSPRNKADWEVFVADVTAGCSVGEWAGEEATLYASSDN